VLGRLSCAGAALALHLTIMVFGAASGAARLHRSHAVLHDLLHANERILNLGAIGYLRGCEFVPAQPTDKIRTELQLPQPDLEQLLAVGTGQSDPCAPEILEQAAFSG
jgi:hypothetical protein